MAKRKFKTEITIVFKGTVETELLEEHPAVEMDRILDEVRANEKDFSINVPSGFTPKLKTKFDDFKINFDWEITK